MKNKTIFKILSIIMILALIIGSINISSYATVTSSSTSTITISGLEAGVTSTAYQIATVNIDASGVISDPMYSWVDSVESWLESSNYSNYADIEVFAELDSTTDADTISEIYSAIAAAIKSGEITITTVYTSTTEGEATYPVTDENLNSTATFENVEMGLYVIITENGYRVYMPSAVAVVPEYSDDSGEWTLDENGYEAEVKSSSLTITKTITDEEKEEVSYGTDSTFTCTIVADVPTYLENSESTIYTISDSTDDGGIIIDTDNSGNILSIYGVLDGSEETLTSSVYSIEYTYNSSGYITGYTVTFDYDEISDYDSIKITYRAWLSVDCVVGPDGNSTTAVLTYSNNPYDKTSTGTTISDGAIVYTYGLEIVKVDSDDTSITLSGAVFNMYSSDGSLLFFSYQSDGVYIYTNSEDGSAKENLSTDDNGNLYIYGLDEGTYYLQETVAPDGYVLDSSQKEITLTDADSDGDLDGILDSHDNDEDGVYELTFTNSDGFSLPVTGGIGTTIFMIAGVCLIILGLALKISKKGKNTTK